MEKKKIYIVQSNFSGGKTPIVSKKFENIGEAISNYISQSARQDCSFCNVIEVRARHIVGDYGETDTDTFRLV